MDVWILAACQSLIKFVIQEMAGIKQISFKKKKKLKSKLKILGYRLYTVVPRLVQFIEELTNWYVRFNRKRLKVKPFFFFFSLFLCLIFFFFFFF